MTYNYSRLCGRIREKFCTQEAFAAAIGISAHSISKKLTGKAYWKQIEIERAAELLGIERDQLHLYFFTLQVQSD